MICPICGCQTVVERLCKLLCTNCFTILETCNEA